MRPKLGGLKYDQAKVPVHLVARDFIIATAEVLAKGAEKYNTWNWAEGFAWSRPYRALLGHVLAWGDGEDVDPEWGLSHLAHAACCLMFLIVHQKRGLGVDDRHKWEEKTK